MALTFAYDPPESRDGLMRLSPRIPPDSNTSSIRGGGLDSSFMDQVLSFFVIRKNADMLMDGNMLRLVWVEC